MRGWLLVASLVGCGGGSETPIDAPIDSPDGMSNCQAQGVTGQFTRRSMNPRLLPGTTFTDGKIDTSIVDPDVHWDAQTQQWELYYAANHAMTFSSQGTAVIRRATSSDRVTWTVDDAPVLTASADGAAWDRLYVVGPTVVYNPDAPPNRRYLMLYSGAYRAFPFPGYTFPEYSIGAAFSADGLTFTRISAAESPKAMDGLVLTGTDIYASLGSIVADPELVLVEGIYHVWFSSLSCKGVNCATLENAGVAHATSSDGIHWTTAEAPVRSLLRASADTRTGGFAPSVIYDDVHCRWEMWLANDLPGDTSSQPVELDNMAGVWHADSTDGASWHINYVFARELVWQQAEPGEGLGLQIGADVGITNGGRLMLYVGYDDQNVPSGFTLPDSSGTTPGVMTLNVATRDLL